MTDIPQDLVDRVAAGLWDSHGIHGLDVSETAVAAMLDGVTLEWKSHEQDTERTETEFGRYTVHFGGPFPVYSTPDRDGNHGSDDPKAAALADYRARLLKAMGGV